VQLHGDCQATLANWPGVTDDTVLAHGVVPPDMPPAGGTTLSVQPAPRTTLSQSGCAMKVAFAAGCTSGSGPTVFAKLRVPLP
jgi:hypothetical protein